MNDNYLLNLFDLCLMCIYSYIRDAMDYTWYSIAVALAIVVGSIVIWMCKRQGMFDTDAFYAIYCECTAFSYPLAILCQNLN